MNAHPHKAGRTIVVHNGIIENYSAIKARLVSLGCNFVSQTDTEVIAQLIDYYLQSGESSISAIQRACNELSGIICRRNSRRGRQRYSVRRSQRESPHLGLGEGQAFVASDVPAILPYTSNTIFMDDGEIAVIRRDKADFITFDGKEIQKVATRTTLDAVSAAKGGYKHFMLKEIFEQPQAVTNTFRGKVSRETGEINFEGVTLSDREARNIQRIIILACGTSYHAGLVGRRILEDVTRIPVEVDIGSEFRYRNPIVGPNTLLISISQSGETADTLAASREAIRRGAKMIAISNVMQSSIGRLAQLGTIYTQAGPEIGVASTKAFTTQIAVLYLMAIYLAEKQNSIPLSQRRELIRDLLRLPPLMEQCLNTQG